MEKITGTTINDGLASGTLFIYVGECPSNVPDGAALVIAAKDLTPQDTLSLCEFNIVAMITTSTTTNSHVAILSRVKDLPVVTGITLDHNWNGKEVIVDGNDGSIVIEPDKHERRLYDNKRQAELLERNSLDNYRGRKAEIDDMPEIKLYANIADAKDAAKVLDNDADGIGNFKTEFIFLETDHLPTEDEQFEIYKNLACQMGGRKTVIRTIDLGADKTPAYMPIPKEENPALGYRAIRICLDNPDIFRTQLRAILRASAYGEIAVMYPMIVSVDEVRKIKSFVANVMEELKLEGIPFKENIEQGIMVETPASVIMSRELAKEVDFFSIGTNDLTQYTLAIDRHNNMCSKYMDPYHPAVLRSIEYVVKNAHTEGKWVEISGELASDFEMTEQFSIFGIDALAVSPSKILKLKKHLFQLYNKKIL